LVKWVAVHVLDVVGHLATRDTSTPAFFEDGLATHPFHFPKRK